MTATDSATRSFMTHPPADIGPRPCSARLRRLVRAWNNGGFGRQLAEGIFGASDLFISNRLPEVMGGLQRDERHPHPGIYPESHEPQAWSASMIVMVVQALLGIYPFAPAGLLVIDPHLPPWLPDLRLSGITVGRSRLDIEFRRGADGTTRYRIHGREGRVGVIRQPVPDGPEATIPRRAATALRSLPWPLRAWR